MAKPAIAVQQVGQSIWLDNISRGTLISGEFQAMVANDGVTGVTSNPTIFEKAIGAGTDYDAQIAALAARGLSDNAIFDELARQDLQQAADILRPVYDRTGGNDGFVSWEVLPVLANDTDASLREAVRLFRLLDRPNVMIKIPGTRAGLPAIEQALYEGVNINITLLFAISRHEEVMEAYLSALERRVAEGKPVDRLRSVASFFVSRVDTLVDKTLEARMAEATPEVRQQMEALRGRVAIANAKMAYQRFLAVFSGPRWQALERAGAAVQRPLWASTSTKDPRLPDTYYVDTLVGPHTVNTVPPATLAAFNDHGATAVTVTKGVDEARDILDRLAQVGIDLVAITDQLEEEGVRSFADSFTKLTHGIAAKRAALGAGTAGQDREAAQPGMRPFEEPVDAALRALAEQAFVRRIWAHDGALWGADPAVQATARERLGWLHTPDIARKDLGGLHAFVEDLRREGFTHAVVLGMGGSSLAPEVLRETFGVAPGFLHVETLDSTDPDAVRAVEARLDLPRTLFIVASKSGTTTEPNAFMAYFWAKQPHGRQFVAITDPGSKLEQVARERGFRHVFEHHPDVGGRYAALTNIGLVPAACMGIDLETLIERARAMAAACREESAVNPGLRLGAVLGALAKGGRDKVTLICSPGIGTFGYWVEQLVAESTGKAGTGILPVEGEPPGDPKVYGADRVFIYLRLDSAADAGQDRLAESLAGAGRPVLTLHLADVLDMGAEFFRWEFAVPVAATIIGVEPFDQPNVQESKDNTNRLLREAAAAGALPAEPALLTDGPVALSARGPARDAIGDGGTLAEALRRLLTLVHPGDYVAFTAYLAAGNATEAVLDRMRALVRDRCRVATTSGYGPRFLHSTGQLHKGGADNGVFVQAVSHPAHDLDVPGEGYTFERLKEAQALGDLQSLQSRGRRAVRLDFATGVDPAAGLEAVEAALRQALA